jgi:hypothetical protein
MPAIDWNGQNAGLLPTNCLIPMEEPIELLDYLSGITIKCPHCEKNVFIALMGSESTSDEYWYVVATDIQDAMNRIREDAKEQEEEYGN